MAPVSDDTDKVPIIVESFIRQLLVANKAVSLYPPGGTIPREAAEQAARILDEVLERYAEVTIAVSKKGLFFGEQQVFPGQSASLAFAVALYHRRLVAVRFHAGASYRDIIAFLTILKNTPEDIAAGGGFEAQLWDQGVGAITVAETQVTVVDAQVAPSAPWAEAESEDERPVEQAPPKKRELEALPRLRERIEIAHIVGDPQAAREYLRARKDSDGFQLGVSGTARRFSALARLVAEVDPAEEESIVASLAEALWDLEPELRRRLLVERVLPEARVSEPLAAAVRALDLADVSRMLAADTDSVDPGQEGLVRALRNLSQVSHADRAHFTQAAEAGLIESGMDASKVRDVLGRVLPLRLKAGSTQSLTTSLDAPAAAMLQLLDHATAGARLLQADPAVAELTREAECAISDGQVIDALLTLVVLDNREIGFASTMSALEDQLGVLVARGEVDAAADAALSLLTAAKNPDLSAEQKRRLEQAVLRFARPNDMRTVTKALWLFKPGEPEHEASRRLLEALGPIAIPVILEQLADEPDRTIRKALVDLLSRDAAHYIPEIGSHLSDSRWYFVRNVVAILGSTNAPAAVPYLERTLRHHDVRVRRETIRALSSVGDRRAMEMLMVTLADDDAQNVQLAARYLGLRGERAAVPALEAVARGGSQGNRENGPRVEAIEALGRIGSPEALPTLRALASKRLLFGAARYREIKAASAAAIAAITLAGKEGATS